VTFSIKAPMTFRLSFKGKVGHWCWNPASRRQEISPKITLIVQVFPLNRNPSDINPAHL
jgi:hypothetical protein